MKNQYKIIDNRRVKLFFINYNLPPTRKIFIRLVWMSLGVS